MRIPIKPLSVNTAWKGKRFKTPEYKAYEQEVMLYLRPKEVPDGEFCIVLEFGISYSGFDYDNGIKPFTDILQKKYGFNDSRIVKAFVTKTKTEKGNEFIWFDFYNDLAVVGV